MGAEVIRIESRRRPDPYRERTISHLINQGKKKDRAGTRSASPLTWPTDQLSAISYWLSG
jgi:crotonobetainyl-CoA:carnitine CoA-transferase CaiB-like acyl-CoA transferase